MLVLSRKSGEEIVLPSCGVTIAVVRISANKVRLGIQAPPEASVHRREVWDRIHAGQGTCGESEPTVSTHDRPSANERTTPAQPSESDLRRLLAQRITQRAGGRIRSLQVDRVDGRIVVSGRTSTYYARQLACAATVELLGRPNMGPDDVHFDIQVIPSAPENRGG